MSNVLVIGDVMLDVTVRGVVTRGSPEDKSVGIVRARDWLYNLGGAGNTAEILALAGHNVTLLGAIAHDWVGDTILNLCHLLGIKHKLHPVLAVSTTRLRVYDGGRYIIRADIDRFVDVPPWRWDVGAFDAVIVSDYGLGLLHEGCAQSVARLPHPVVVDAKPANWMKIYSGLTAMVPNRLEGERIAQICNIQWSNHEDLVMNLRAYFRLGCCVLTMGDRGALIATDDGDLRHISAPDVRTPQVIGAGDAFTAHMAVCLGDGLGYVEAAEVACAAASEYVARQREAIEGSLLA